MLGYFIFLLPFSICYGYTMQMIMHKNKNRLYKASTCLIAALGIYFLCYSYVSDPNITPLEAVIVDVVSQWTTPAIIPLALAIMNGLQHKKMIDGLVSFLFAIDVILGVGGTVVHVFGLGEEAHQYVCLYAFNYFLAAEILISSIIIFKKMGGRDFNWHRLWTFFTKNTSSRPLMVIGVSFIVFGILSVERLIFLPSTFYEYYALGIARLIFTSFILLLLCNALMQVNNPWITLKSLFDPMTVVGQIDEEETEIAESENNEVPAEALPSELNTMSVSESMEVLDRVDQLAQALRHYIEEEQAYLQADINIEKVAAHLGTNRFYISRLVNVEQAMSFRDYINMLRIEHSKKYMKEHPGATQEQTAFVCGFSSASYFNRKFKQINGISPQDWKGR